MGFDSRKAYVASCITAAVGSLLEADYNSRDFDYIIGFETAEQSVCSMFIRFVKSMDIEKAKQYATRTNFNDYLLNQKQTDSLTDVENTVVDLIYEQIDYNKAHENEGLKEPANLFKALLNARKKLNLANSIRSLTDKEVFKGDPITWGDKYAETLQKEFSEALDTYDESTEDKLFFADDLAKHYTETLDARENGEIYMFHNKVFDSLITEGPTPGHGGIIGGSTGMGKSALCLNLVNDLINADVPAMYFPIEMGLDNTLDRLAALRLKMNFRDIVRIGRPETPSEVRQAVEEEINKLRVHSNFAVVSDPNITIRKLRNYIKRFMSKLPGRKYCIVIIDLITMISEFYAEDGNMAQMIEKAINMLDILAKELNFHYIGVVQLNRSVESDKVTSVQAIDKLRPTRSAIKNSNALLERARWAITIFRKKYFADLYLTEEEAEGIDDIAEIQLMKANDEAIGRRYMRFDGPSFCMTYDESYGKSANGF